MVKRGGFSMIELLIVVLVFGIIVALGAPAMIASLTDAEVSSAANEVATALKTARSAALADGRSTKVTVNSNLNTVAVERWTLTTMSTLMDPAQTELPEATVDAAGVFSPMKHPVDRTTDYTIQFGQEKLLDAVDVVSASFGGTGWVTFDAYGVPSSGGSVTVGSGDRRATVTLVAETGMVTIAL